MGSFYFCIIISAYKYKHQLEVKSAETEFIEGQREHERSRTKHTEEQTG